MAGQIRQTVLQVTQLHRQLGKIIRRVARSDEHFVVEKGGLPVAVMMSMTAYEELVGEQRLAEFERHARALGEEAERRGITEEQMMEEVEEVRQRLYQENYGDPSA